ncbi:MAG TPA: prolyl oligopeptidase family serine peptidase, partial [Segetibacter sp.]
MMKIFLPLLITLASSIILNAQPFTLQSIKSYPFPNELTSASKGSAIAWVFNEDGKRNIYVAQGPDFRPRKLTNYNEDDGQEITSLSISDDGKWIVYVRGGDHGSNWDDDVPVNATFAATPIKTQIWSIPFAGGDPKALAEGDDPRISPRSTEVAFIKSGQVWNVPIDGSSSPKNVFTTRGSVSSIEWSPDGSQLLFTANRTDHSFIGVYTNNQTPINWVAPSFYRDRSARWSPNGKQVVFVRTEGGGGSPDSILVKRHQPWSIWIADVATGEAQPIWKAPKTLQGSIPTTHGGTNLHWAANDRIVFLSYHDGWPHLYSVASSGGNPLLLTPGSFMAEHISLSHDKNWLLFSANAGSNKNDIDRRHIARVPVDKAQMEVLTRGEGLEWTPVLTGDGSTVAYISATAQRPPLPTTMNVANKQSSLLGQNLIPVQFPQNQLVIPKQVIFKSADGVTVHGQLFEPTGAKGKTPAIIYVHGGPPRQMLLGWNYSDYYSNAYAYNQYLASLGFTVLSVNYRLGIGYGYNFHQPQRGGATGASEYNDIKAAALWLATQPNIDAKKIGIYGGSYGGFLTALALGRDSKLFAAGVDIHGVHDFTIEKNRNLVSPDRFERAPDADLASKTAWTSSPVSYIKTWTSPVLIIHGDDDRNVRFSQSTDLVKRLESKGVPIETLVIVD